MGRGGGERVETVSYCRYTLRECACVPVVGPCAAGVSRCRRMSHRCKVRVERGGEIEDREEGRQVTGGGGQALVESLNPSFCSCSPTQNKWLPLCRALLRYVLRCC